MDRSGTRRLGVAAAAGLAAFLGGLGGEGARAEEPRWEIGARAIILTAGGEPTNDQTGAGLFGRYRLNGRWLVGAAIEQLSGDFERPYELFGTTSPQEIDGTVDSTLVSGWVEREYGKPERKLRWFWSGGLGVASPDADAVAGPLTGGGTFDIKTDAGSELLLSVAGGLRRRFSRRFGFELGLRADQHFADWKLTDRDNGTTATVDDYTAAGLHFGLRVAF